MKQPIITNQITALYERLSRDDELSGDSISIQTQKFFLEDYAKQHGFVPFAHYTDDGFSGGNFNRPSWNRLVADVEAGKVSAVIVKDMSRVGREYLQTGYYTEIFFPQNHVRFIAVSNNIDSNDRNSSEIAPFLNVINDFYLRDCSHKQKQAYKARGNAGMPYASIPCYGYRKDPADRHHWIVDEEAATVVREIFSLAAKGIGVVEIAKSLSARKVEKPSYYMSTHGIWNSGNTWVHERPYDWNCRTVADILSHTEYLGHTVNGRSTSESYKTHKRIRNDPSEWQIIENTHEAIIDQETFDAVQSARKTVRRTDTTGKANVLTGLVFCADCGKKMYNHKRGSKAKQLHVLPDPLTGLYPIDGYCCSTYELTKYRSDKTCSSHSITSKAIRLLLLNTIREVVRYATFDEERFIRRVREQSEIQNKADAKELQRKIGKSQKRIAELDRLIMKLYEDYALDRIPLERYQQMAAAYEAEQKALKETLVVDQAKADVFTEDTDRAERFLTLAKKYTDFSFLTDEMILAFVDKILVHAPEKIDGERVQEVEIFLKHIGKVELPQEAIRENVISPKQLERIRKKRAYMQEYYRTKIKPQKEAKRTEPNAEKETA